MATPAATATSRATIGTLLGTITETASTLSNTVGALNSSVDMFAAFINKAKADQSDRYKLEREESRQRIIEEMSEAATSRQLRIVELKKDATFAKLYDENHNRFKAALEVA